MWKKQPPELLAAEGGQPVVGQRLEPVAGYRDLAWVDRIAAALRATTPDHPAAADPGVYARDRLHLNTRGHAIVGGEAVRALAAEIPASAAA